MKAVACMIACPCGGEVVQLPYEHGHHVYYQLTERSTIIFSGICSDCGDGVKVERDILSLVLHCPTDQRGN